MVAMSAVKAAGAAGVIFLSEKLRTRNKAAAIGLMIAANSAMAWVVQHNYRLTPP
jgi:threonine/homoserine efflux transporter RhtA